MKGEPRTMTEHFDKAESMEESVYQKPVRHVFPQGKRIHGSDTLPQSMMEQLSTLAACFYMDEAASVIVKGPKSSGKSYLIEYFSLFVQEYAESICRPPVNLIHLSGADLVEIGGGAHMVPQYVEGLCQSMELEPRNICFVIRDADLAMSVRHYVPDCHIILEANHSYIDKTPLPIWSDWMHMSIFDGSTPTFEEIVKVVEFSEDLGPLLKRILRHEKLSSTRAASRWILDVMDDSLRDMSDGRVSIRGNNGSVMGLTFGQVVTTLKIFWGLLGTSFHHSVRPNQKQYQSLMSKACMMYRDNTIGPEGEANHTAGRSRTSNEESAAPAVWRSKPSFSDFSTLEKRLKEDLFGQDEAIGKVSDALVAAGAGFKKPEKPLRSFLFLGPSGVGKTQLAKNIADRFFASKAPLLRLDMSEFSDRYTVSRLTGSTSGYIGYEEGGQLTNFALKNPHGVIILDEVEKAHPHAWDIFLQVLDAGRLTDGKGQEVDFRNFVIVMTSNIGAQHIANDTVGFLKDGSDAFARRQDINKKAALTEMRKIFRDEFINRIDETVVFSELSDDIFDAIVSHEIHEVRGMLRSQYENVRLYSTKAVNEYLLKGADIRKFGAREIQRVVHQKLVTPISKIVTSTSVDELGQGYISCTVDKSSEKLEVTFKKREKNGDKNG